jgi:hypothetical protein
MENWKQAVVVGSLAGSAVLFLKRRNPAGVILAGVGLATLASEYPETFRRIRRELPNYVDRGSKFLEIVSRAGERLAVAAQSRGQSMWEELGI